MIMEITYPTKHYYSKKGLVETPIKMNNEQKHWYELGFMAGYVNAIFEQKNKIDEITKKLKDGAIKQYEKK